MSEVVKSLLQQPDDEMAIPPTLLLGQFERVGSTFYIDQLEKDNLVHNEPYKLLVPSSWPIAKGYAGELVEIDDFFESPEVQGTDKHWLRNFVASLHHPGGQFVKETNLYLALPQFLELFPSSDIRLLTRNPMGIISSFKRNNLYERWGYAHVAENLDIQLNAGQPDNYQALRHMASTGDNWATRLAWMTGVNAVLLSRHVEPERVTEVVSYEDDIVPAGAERELKNGRTEDSIFSTNIHKTHDDFEARLTTEEMAEIGIAMAKCAEFVIYEFDESDRRWFDRLYARHLGSEHGRRGADSKQRAIGNVTTATAPTKLIRVEPGRATKERKLVHLNESQDIVWDYSLVTNEQMADFLQSLVDDGFNTTNNRLLILDNMPPTRGGRIVYNDEISSFTMAEGFGDHPAYWVTWLAAALYAYKEGMRLPTYHEWQTSFSNMDPHATAPLTNHSYAFDDTTPTGLGDSPAPVDFFGNLKIWCSDWSGQHAVSKKLAGISWKNELHQDYNPEAERPYLTNSRIIGIRLVCCRECGPSKKRDVSEVNNLLTGVLNLMEKAPVKTLAELQQVNEQVSRLVTQPICKHSQKNGSR